MKMFGWRDDDIPVVTAAHRAKLKAAERLTDELLLPAYSVLDAAQRGALFEGIGSIEKALAHA
jgi:hypothetical protein